MFGLRRVLMSPDDSLAGSSGLGEDVAFLEAEDQPEGPEHTTEGAPPEGESEEEHQEEEEEEKLEGRTEIAPHERPTYTDLKKAFPDLFDKFSGLKDVIFREKAYTDLFTSIEDAKTAQSDSEAFNNMRNDIFTGDGSILFKSIKDQDPKALTNFATNFLPTLFKIDQEAHWAAANPILESMVRGLYATGKDEDKKAAETFASFLWSEGGKDVLEGRRTFIRKKEEQRVDPERQQFQRERLQAFQGDIFTNSRNGILSSITAKDKNGKSRLDPDEVFSPWMTTQLAQSIYADIDKQLTEDKDHMRYMNGLWKKAEEAKFSSEWKTRIVDAYLARARQLVPATRARIVSEALGTSRKRSDKTRESVERNRRPEGGGGGGQSRSQNGAGKKIDYAKSSDDDIINDNITYK